MKSNTQKFIECLEEAEDILEDYPSVNFSGVDFNLKYADPEHFNLALFEHWSEFCEPDTQQKLPIRIIQHLSCTGGTLISKCLAAMPNVALLSESNPLSSLQVVSESRCAPTDLTYLATQGNFPLIDELSEKIFQADIDVIAKHIKQLGKYLVIREHSHSDYLVGESPNESSTVRKLLKNEYPLLSILTVRHPVDSYLSLLNNGWVHFKPETFDEYCNRYLYFIKHNNDVPTYKYEDFVDAPDIELRRICESLNLPFNEDFQDIFDLNRLSGDSGRSSTTITKRERREFDKDLYTEIIDSTNFKKLCNILEYDFE